MIVLVGIFAAVLVVFFRILRAESARVQIQGRHILVTGGSSGIGLEIAKLAAAEGARKITLLARNVDQLSRARQEVIDSASGRGTDVCIASADVLDFPSVEREISNAGPIDVLVCSHGLAIPREFQNAPLEELLRVVNVNLVGTIQVLKAALPGMKNADYPRSLAVFSSQAGQVGIYGYAAYAASKGALRFLAEGLRQEVIGDKIQVSVIYPPDTNTPGFVEENKTKPEVTKLLSASSAGMEAVDVARISLRGIKAGKFNVACSFDGHLLAIANSGMSPQTSAAYAALEAVALPFVRIISLCVQFDWSRRISAWRKNHKKAS